MIKSCFFILFLLSGVGSLVDEVVWTRLAMAGFGVTALNISIVLSVFMLGLAIGSWLVGRWCGRLPDDSAIRPIILYSICELLIAAGAVLAPRMLAWGRGILVNSPVEWASPSYTAMSSLCILAALLPWTICMGATFPLGMKILRRLISASEANFSFLYLANVLGATIGTILSAFVLIELLGFTTTLGVAAGFNGLAGLLSLSLLRWRTAPPPAMPLTEEQPLIPESRAGQDRGMLFMLFLTGLAGLAMEVVWIRLYTPFLGNYVYTFAAILGLYLAATYVGSLIYRASLASGKSWEPADLCALFALACLLPLLSADPRVFLVDDLMRLAGIMPACIAMGAITPQLIDRWSRGDPGRVGKGYAVNVIGCILGPLLAGFVLIPLMGERPAIVMLTLLVLGTAFGMRSRSAWGRPTRWGTLIAALVTLVFTRTAYDRFEADHPEARTIRDHTATATAFGKNYERVLLLNGCGMTSLTPVCKILVHLPLSLQAEKPKKILIICFGMGTSFRSALSWGATVTSVELTPGVYRLFDFYHDDADAITREHSQRMLADDGRRFLERTRERFDLIVIDPAPPIQSAGCSLLYSRQFLELVKQRLSPSGIMSHWLKTSADDPVTVSAVMKAAREVFPHVRIHQSLSKFGYHILAADHPLEEPDVPTMMSRLPPPAMRDWMEWNFAYPAKMMKVIVAGRISTAVPIAKAPSAPVLDDDHPINEYFLLRQLGLIRWDTPADSDGSSSIKTAP